MSAQIKQPLVSIITPSYNSTRFIPDTINSVMAQTYENWEMLIVDDCSKDESRQLIRSFIEQDERIKLIELTENSGAAVARNTAIKAAKGKYIAFLDSDDLWVPEKLEKQIAFMEENDYAFTYTEYELMDVDGNLLNRTINVPSQINYKGLLRNTIIGCLTVVVNREKTGPFEMPNIRTRQDFALWLSILKRGITAHGLQEVLAKYRLVPGSISSNKVKAAKQTWKVYRDIEKLNLTTSIISFLGYAFHAVKKTYLK
ncbi:glycosyltransferase family 2 protein [Metabacillus fastidiosus]|uniref:glycosyltransferase family 2 protein n=1 Tax=Metabacillus fastidiosus TaxID=1458 RepID=UPI002DBB89A1|nr:glycosyltransferase family 2 protein [Metabacillus fastidiosus]MEC2076093.1 glycosyltransferase family 2 protein [Metabacillus fastidiosus]